MTLISMLSNLNKQQREAVVNSDGPLRLVAGPGSGKTRVITTKIGYLIREKGVSAGEILAITFTNKATNEMRRRLTDLLGGAGEEVHITTFHSLCFTIIKRDGERLGIPKRFSILDDYSKKQLVKIILAEIDIEASKRVGRYNIIELISYLKNNLIEASSLISEPKRYYKLFNKFLDLKNPANLKREEMTDSYVVLLIADLFKSYENRKELEKKQDFDDLIINAWRLLSNEDNLGAYWKEKYTHILVDEFQDTSLLQYEIVRILALRSNNITVVGDTDQTIYTWRGADPKIMLTRIEEDFPDLMTVKLEQNYRSTPDVVRKANKLISHNKSRIEKSLFTLIDDPTKTELTFYMDSFDEARGVVAKVKNLLISGVKPRDVSIIFRTNNYSRFCENYLLQENIPFKVLNKLSFYERRVVKDYFDYLRVLLIGDNLSLLNVINIPPRGLGPETLKKIFKFASTQGLTVIDYLFNNLEHLEEHGAEVRIGRKTVGLILEFVREIEWGRAEIGRRRLSSFLRELIFKRLGYAKIFTSERDLSEADDLLTILINIIKRWEEKNPKSKYADFLDYIALISPTNDDLLDDNSVSCITAHSAKGLEFNYVFVLGLSEYLFPILVDTNDTESIEEERRLFYVAATRTKKKLYLSSVRFGARQGSHLQPSRFLKEMGFWWRSITQV